MTVTVILFIKIIRLDLIIFVKMTKLVQSIDFTQNSFPKH